LVAAIAVLIITCPCALGLAVPVTHVVAANRLFKEGVIMRDGSALERLAEVETVFFDKTGTLTSDVMALAALPELPKDDASVLLSLAEKSRHPVSRAIAKAYHSQAAAELSDIAEIAGSGIEAIWNGRKVRLGRADWVAQISKTKFDLPSGGTLFFIENEKPVVFQLISDLKADAGKAVEQLLESGYPITILSGDHRSNVEDVAARTGIENWVSDLAPKQKIIKINGLRDEGKKVLMIGDGLNDAPSLAAAHVSMAPASATDVSRASADFVYTRQSLLIVPFTLKLSKAAGMIVYQNFALAIAYNCIAVPLAIAGHVTPLIAALAMSASSIVVVANSMRLAIFDRKFSLADSTTQKRTDRLQEMSETSLVQS
jgi:Cu2+-exporting ATPase